MLTPKEEKMDISEIVNTASPMDVTEPPNADFVTPKSTGHKLSIPGRKKVIRVGKTRLLKGSLVPKMQTRGVVRASKPNIMKRAVVPKVKTARIGLRGLVVPKILTANIGAQKSYKDMVEEAVFDLGKRKAITRNAIRKFIVDKYEHPQSKRHVITNTRKAINSLVEDGTLVEVKGEHKAPRYRLAHEVREHMKKTAKTGAAAPSPAKKPRKDQSAKTVKTPTKTVKTSATTKKATTPSKKVTEKAGTTPVKKTSQKKGSKAKGPGNAMKASSSTKKAASAKRVRKAKA